MTRGHPPFVAIGEAERKAAAMGCSVYAVDPDAGHPFHFITCEGDCVSFIRVRRLKHPGYEPAEIEVSCRNDIAQMRTITVTQEIFRQLWVRGPGRHWYRYLVLPDAILVLEDENDDDDEKNGEEGGGAAPPSPPPVLSGVKTGAATA